VEARTGNLKHAVELWQEVFERTPYRSTVGLNLAIAFCASGQKDIARQFVQRVLQFNPDSGKAKSLMTNITKNEPSQCKP
jgi:lipopolysaccharide biosynthesis regulator YciM